MHTHTHTHTHTFSRRALLTCVALLVLKQLVASCVFLQVKHSCVSSKAQLCVKSSTATHAHTRRAWCVCVSGCAVLATGVCAWVAVLYLQLVCVRGWLCCTCNLCVCVGGCAVLATGVCVYAYMYACGVCVCVRVRVYVYVYVQTYSQTLSLSLSLSLCMCEWVSLEPGVSTPVASKAQPPTHTHHALPCGVHVCLHICYIYIYIYHQLNIWLYISYIYISHHSYISQTKYTAIHMTRIAIYIYMYAYTYLAN